MDTVIIAIDEGLGPTRPQDHEQNSSRCQRNNDAITEFV
jgi:hypothetical protein